jgi:hypothetical protein
MASAVIKGTVSDVLADRQEPSAGEEREKVSVSERVGYPS